MFNHEKFKDCSSSLKSPGFYFLLKNTWNGNLIELLNNVYFVKKVKTSFSSKAI